MELSRILTVQALCVFSLSELTIESDISNEVHWL